MNLGYRLNFENVGRLRSEPKTDYLIELAMPLRIDRYDKIRGELAEIPQVVRNKGLNIVSIHAPGGRITKPIAEEKGPSFEVWFGEVSDLADQIGAASVTLHPNKLKYLKGSRDRADIQRETVEILRKLQKRYNAILAIETFKEPGRVFTPEDIVKYGLPMVLDVSHIPYDQSEKLVETYSDNIVTVHLSSQHTPKANGEKPKSHLPIDDFCIGIVQTLQEERWNGNIILEYLPQHQNKQFEDLKRLEEMLR